ncbi:hypothetical protein [Methylohalobius crimeensis]|uniref:hypothetical protein n=1 Tax=Methylohalobius crimeensis TaxID=244365 RepID=UPI0003B3ADB9|nr:hypothetical protein [Methylohalobius crimeensis]
MELDKIGHALSKQIPAMIHGFSILTKHGELEIHPEDAPPFIALAEQILRQRLDTLRRNKQSPENR